MPESIKEFWIKIKSLGERVLSDRELFPALLIVTVGVASFGLGRLSITSMGVSQGQRGAVLVEEAPPEAAAEATTGEVQYVGSKNSDKYHLPECTGAQRISEENKVYFSSKEEAEASGYTPASNCDGL